MLSVSELTAISKRSRIENVLITTLRETNIKKYEFRKQKEKK